MYALFHPDYVFHNWHVFIAYMLISWTCCAIVLFANRALPLANDLGLFFIIAGVLISIIVCAIMPGTGGGGYASNAFVWKDWVNTTGYSSDGFTFVMGMLNGAYAVGTPGKYISHQGTFMLLIRTSRLRISFSRRDPKVCHHLTKCISGMTRKQTKNQRA